MARHIGASDAKGHVAHVLGRVITDEMLSDHFWERHLPGNTDACSFGHGGLQQFVLDVRYMQACTKGVIVTSSEGQ